MRSRRYVYHNLLQLIVDGEIALTSIPCYLTSNERAKIWARNHCRILDPLSALSIGNTAFNSVCANVSRIDWVEMVQKSVDDDIVTIQRHPAVLYEYRRFIVVKGAKDPAVTPISVCDPLDACKYLWWKHFFRLKLRPLVSLISRTIISKARLNHEVLNFDILWCPPTCRVVHMIVNERPWVLPHLHRHISPP